MSTKQSTINFLLEQIQQSGDVRARKMFGEYGVYCNDKIVALVCDDRLYVKPTEIGRKFLLIRLKEAPPYPGAKNYFLISEDYWDDKEWLTELIIKTADALPLPQPKKIRDTTQKVSK